MKDKEYVKTVSSKKGAYVKNSNWRNINNYK